MWDPLPRLVASPEPGARWIAHAVLMAKPPTHPDVRQAHADVLADPATEDLLARLVEWEAENPVSGHDKPQFAPNLLALLADIGVTEADDERIAAILDAMLRHQSPDGRFLSLLTLRGTDGPVWSSLPCDHHAILETLVRAGRVEHPAVADGLRRLLDDLRPTRQGPGWECLPDAAVGFRGPGRAGDICPQVTVEALRALSYVPRWAESPEVLEAARSALGVWRRRGEAKPYMFGHGRAFKRGKWPPTWYSALAVVDAVGRYPALWEGGTARAEDRRAMAELAACLIAYTVGVDGSVTPQSVFRGFSGHSFGQKTRPSDLATARTAVAVARVSALWPDIAQVDVAALPGSRGGGDVPLPPGFASWGSRAPTGT